MNPPASDDDSAAGAFRLVDEEAVHNGYAIDVVVATYEAPDGHRFTRDVIRHLGAVAVVPLHDDGTVTLVRQYRAPIDRQLLEIPAGLRDVADEAPATTAERELAEEVGLAADAIEFQGSFHNAAGHSDEEVQVFLATGLRPVDDDLQGPEEQAMTVERHALADVRAMIADGRITDAKTIIGILRLPRRGGRAGSAAPRGRRVPHVAAPRTGPGPARPSRPTAVTWRTGGRTSPPVERPILEVTEDDLVDFGPRTRRSRTWRRRP